jgi:hypothetical protein
MALGSWREGGPESYWCGEWERVRWHAQAVQEWSTLGGRRSVA